MLLVSLLGNTLCAHLTLSLPHNNNNRQQWQTDQKHMVSTAHSHTLIVGCSLLDVVVWWCGVMWWTERFRLPDGEKKVMYKNDQKVPDTAIFRINREDHTLGNMLVQYVGQHHTHSHTHHVPFSHTCLCVCVVVCCVVVCVQSTATRSSCSVCWI